MVLFSILIPAYKTTFLHECLRSIIGQSYPAYEIIVVDDCSPNDIKAVVDEMASDKIKYLRNERNCGAVDVVDNWNRCLDYATGNFCICIGDDDEFPANALEEYAKKIAKYPAVDVFHAKTVLIDEKGEKKFIVNTRAEYESCIAFIRHRIDGDLQFVGDFCYRTEKLKAKGGFVKFPLAWGSDDVTAYMMAKEGGVVNLEAPSFYYRVNEFSISSTGNLEIKIKAIEQQRKWLRDFVSSLSCSELHDKLTQQYVLNHLDANLDYKISGLISDDVRANKMRILYWLKNKSQYRINKNTLIYGLLRAFR